MTAYDVPGGRDDVGASPRRLGSSVSKADGQFVISYEPVSGHGHGPTLVLEVTAPEVDGEPPKVLYRSGAPRVNAGRSEAFVVRLDPDVLAKGGVDTDGFADSPTALAARIARLEGRQGIVSKAISKAAAATVATRRARQLSFHGELRTNLIAKMSRVPASGTALPGFVSPGESVSAKNIELLKNGLSALSTPKSEAGIGGFASLTSAQKDQLDALREDDGSVSAAALEQVLGSDDEPMGGVFTRLEPILEICRPQSDERDCGEEALGLSEPTTTDDAPPESPPSSDPAALNIEHELAALFVSMRSPEEGVAFGVDAPQSEAREREAWSNVARSVRDRIRGLDIEPGPADTTAYFDFHDLRIAFEHVWQEAIDEGVLDVGEDIYDQIVELGGDASISDFDGLVREARVIVRTRDAMAAGAAGKCDEAAIVRDHRDESGLGGLLDYLGIRTGRGCATEPPPKGPTVPSPSSGGDHKDWRNRLPALIRELGRRLKEAYPFTIYGADEKERSINFGVLVTYRQKWEPLGYQAGELAKTITLAPGEFRKYSTQQRVARKRSTKEVEKNVESQRTEESETSRAQSEIVAKALDRTNFTLTARTGIDIPGLTDTWAQSSYGKRSQRASEDIKKQFREAVYKASQEYRSERSVEVSTEETVDQTTTESGEIKNENDEIPVTYLFYELERRFRVSEQIHRVTPVVFVAQEVPKPAEIDEAWLVAHDWILNRVLLDDSFRDALEYLSTRMAGDEVGLEQLAHNLQVQRDVVQQLKEELVALRSQVKGRYRAFEVAVQRQASAADGGLLGGLLDSGIGVVPAVGAVAGFLGFGSGSDEAARIRREAADAAYEEAVREERNLLDRLEREVTALNHATDAYNRALRDFVNGRAQIGRLRLHVKQNILYYMQAIWSHEPPDQRFFRLHQVPVPTLRVVAKRYKIGDVPDAIALAAPAHRRRPSAGAEARLPYRITAHAEFDTELEFEPLSKAADLDDLLGFKGNYMIFPLVEGNDLTDFMIDPYVDRGLQSVIDPDDPGNWTLEEFAEYVCCLKKHVTGDDFTALLPDLRAQYEILLRTPRRQGEIITVPTGSLYIDALPGVRPVLEPFKLVHRAIDVKKVQAEVRAMELENLRKAARLLGNKLEDPDIEKKIVVEAPGSVSVSTGDESA